MANQGYEDFRTHPARDRAGRMPEFVNGEKMFIGTKLINAEPMTRLAYNNFRGWRLPEDDDGADEGYLVEYLDGGTANVSGRAGYISWSPKDVFERSYRPATAMTFGLAIEAMRLGKKVARTGWNGKDMWITISPGAIQLPADRFWNMHNKAFAESKGGFADVQSYITMKTAQDQIQMGWLATQSDMLADDWMIVE